MQEIKIHNFKIQKAEKQIRWNTGIKRIYKKAVIKVPKKQKKVYTKWLGKKGITKRIKIK